ncbi:hypothetical protein EW146_g4865 [Bondarzewia mesenterica]|uniref:PH domain-containing protein n=1 Tax=Bondarzewia mesenterica TaxID=1095465 RepID=A0A4S4LYZ1_9AGAM|nr:hypothetical protein EW146_g4865 [Bondarzewia mesenterica]
MAASLMDETSEIYSLYSHPAMTRASTADYSEPVATPLDVDEIESRSSLKQSVLGPRLMSTRRNGDTARVYSGASDVPHLQSADRPLTMVPETREYDPEPYGPYFSRQPNQLSSSSGAKDLKRHRSTKELIRQFELLDPTPPVSSLVRTPSPAVNVKRFQGLSPPRPGKVEKKKSPLRQSLRNLLSVFSKKGKASNKDNSDTFLRPPRPAAPIPQGNISLDDPFLETRLDPVSRKQTKPGSAICISPTYALYSGSLLHLSGPSSSILPVWTSCEVVLHATHLLLTSRTSQGTPSTEVISLLNCADVRSLSLKDLEQDERDLLPAQRKEDTVKVFELLFDDRKGQRFAGPSVKERAGWVSAIWDAILCAQDKSIHERNKAEMKKVLRVNVETSEASSVDIAPTSAHESSTVDLATSPSHARSTPISAHGTDRDLPPLPQDSETLFDELTQNWTPRTSRLLSVNSPTSSRLSPAPSPTSRSQSPSIMNLGHMSVVKQRLADIQRTNSNMSSSSHSGRSSLSTRPTTPASSRNSSMKTSCRPLGLERPHNDKGESRRSPISSGSDISSPVSSVSHYSGMTTPRPKSAFRMRDEMREQDKTLPKTRASGKDISGLGGVTHDHTGPYYTAEQTMLQPTAMDEISTVLEALDIHSARHHEHTSALEDRIVAVHGNVKDVSEEIRLAKTERERDSAQLKEMHSMLQDVGRTIACGRPVDNSEGLAHISEKLDTIANDLQQSRNLAADVYEPRSISLAEAAPIAEALDEINSRMRDDFPALLDVLKEMKSHQSSSSTILRDVSASAMPDSSPSTEAIPGMNEKLETLLTVVKGLDIAQLDKGEASRTGVVEEILTLLKDAQGQRNLQMEQQSDGVRYLNELNTWLEAFVNTGTAQIQQVAAGVQHLCKSVGIANELQDEDEGNNAEAGDQSETLLGSIRQLVADGKMREQDSANLQRAIDGLIAAMNEDMRKNAEMRNAYTTESVIGLIDRQRQDHERMLKSLATELSDDIRGERLRFVEAMKEATAINVQVHVEEFKKELTREVLLMTQEVGRLQRERQTLEQQIADLFAFYARQKQAMGNGARAQPLSQPAPKAKSRAISQGRALPNPPGA